MKTNESRTSAPFDGYVRRLLGSSNPAERESLFFGHTLHHEYPVLVPTELLFEHMHVLGAPGTGKTALGLAPTIVQLVRRDDGPVIVLDLKGDMALFNTVRLETQRSGRKFKWFTNKPYRSSYIFNPWRQAYLETIDTAGNPWAVLAVAESASRRRLRSWLLQHESTDVDAGFPQRGVGPGKRSAASSSPAAGGSAVVRRSGRNCFVDVARGNDQYRQSDHLLHVLESLVDLPQLNMSPSRNPNEPALQHAIHMPEVVRDNQVVYFYLQSLMDVTTVAEIARLVMYSAVSAAIAHRDETGRKPRVYLVADEAQILVAQKHRQRARPSAGVPGRLHSGASDVKSIESSRRGRPAGSRTQLYQHQTVLVGPRSAIEGLHLENLGRGRLLLRELGSIQVPASEVARSAGNTLRHTAAIRSTSESANRSAQDSVAGHRRLQPPGEHQHHDDRTQCGLQLLSGRLPRAFRLDHVGRAVPRPKPSNGLARAKPTKTISTTGVWPAAENRGGR